jgi:hypothetical protein
MIWQTSETPNHQKKSRKTWLEPVLQNGRRSGLTTKENGIKIHVTLGNNLRTNRWSSLTVQADRRGVVSRQDGLASCRRVAVVAHQNHLVFHHKH